MISQQDMMRQALGKVMATAWIDPEFKTQLFANPRKLLAEVGLLPPPHLELQVVENTTDRTYIALPAPWSDTSDAAFMQQLRETPRKVLSGAGINVPDNSEVIFLENTNSRMHIILPIAPGSEELSIEKI